ncbi:YbjN domain-containing protein [Chroococcidiopsis sp. CCALA 051]|uniref:YbjN domain-containing protein n=1 Tax=Chroococcidiopsis sp. CCALA 051 TaxID=869949 RepID=UPI000D0CCEF4|nr:YbjN domain-containing protein [Chroococcidiopsis sp. CCALA 051]MBE9019460.1 YbjN domain-containing protein [Chroococcidiopsidales cyanobacterium LEGE 13417]PSM50587.1 YbjN domain-containing protein [Chroococcidiopsis sp. CCALA 051]
MTSDRPDPATVVSDSMSSEEILEELVEGTGINHVEVIETVIASLQQDESAMVSHTQNSYLWKFKYGSVEVFVQLTGQTDEDTFKVWSAVLKLPTKNDAGLMRRLLEMNWSDTFEASFGIFDEQIVVLSTRTVAELSAGEVSRLITVVATIADDNDEALQQEFVN